MDIKKNYENLIELQKILTKRFKLEENIFSHQRLMGELSLQQKKLTEKIKIVSTQREYESLDIEIVNSKKKEEEYRFNLLQDQRVIEDLRSALEKDEISIKQQEEDMVKEEERIKNELQKINKELNSLFKKEEELSSGMDENIKYKFERIVRNKDDIGIVSVSSGHCNGCYLTIPIEFINKIRENKEIQFCPNCSRILYYDERPDNIFALDNGFVEEDSEFFDEEV